MEYRRLGQTGIEVSALCFGALTIGPLQAGLNIKEGAQVIRYGLEQGINFIDTAQLYRTYPYIREALRGWDKPVVIASKSYDYSWEGMKNSLEEARSALNRDFVDIFLLHDQDSELTLAGHRPALEYLLEAKTKGLVRAVGVSTHTVQLVKTAADSRELEIIHPIVNYQGYGLVGGGLPELLAALKYAWEKGKGLYGMKPLGGGNLQANAAQALEFAFGVSSLHSVALGCKLREELDFALALLDGRQPSLAVREKVKGSVRSLRIEEWCTGCGRCVEKCPAGLLLVKKGRAELGREGCLLCGYCGADCPVFAIKVY